MPLVSIIIPAYNPGKYLHAAVQSIAAQRFSDYELIIVDDGSPEDLSYIAEIYPTARLIRQANRGQAVARNVGMHHSVGELIAFLDQDDVWMPTYLERQVAMMQSDPEIALCHTQFSIVNSDGHVVAHGFGRQQSYTQMVEGSGICGASTVMVRREACLSIGAFDPLCQPAEDYDLWLRCAKTYRTGFIPSVEACYRIHGRNQSRAYQNTYAAIRNILEKHLVRAQAQKQSHVILSARKGLRVISDTFGGQAFDECRASLRDKNALSFANHLLFATLHNPIFLGKSLLTYPFRKYMNQKDSPN